MFVVQNFSEIISLPVNLLLENNKEEMFDSYVILNLFLYIMIFLYICQVIIGIKFIVTAKTFKFSVFTTTKTFKLSSIIASVFILKFIFLVNAIYLYSLYSNIFTYILILILVFIMTSSFIYDVNPFKFTNIEKIAKINSILFQKKWITGKEHLLHKLINQISIYTVLSIFCAAMMFRYYSNTLNIVFLSLVCVLFLCDLIDLAIWKFVYKKSATGIWSMYLHLAILVITLFIARKYNDNDSNVMDPDVKDFIDNDFNVVDPDVKNFIVSTSIDE